MGAPATAAPSRSGLAFETIADRAAFAGLTGEWDGLVRGLERPTPFLLHGWLDAWWTHHADDRMRVHVEVARRDGRLVGALPLCTSARLGVPVTRFVGGDRSALADVLVASGEPAATARELVGRGLRAGGGLIDLFGLAGSSRLAAACEPGRLRLVPRVEAPVIDLSAGWDAVYRAKTSSRRRSLHRRRRRQLGELGTLAVEHAREPAALAAALEAAFALHERRFADRPDASGLATANGQRFERAGLRALAAAGVARIALLRLDGEPIAFTYWMAFERRMFLYRLAFDPEHARFSPGMVAMLDTLQAASEEGVERVELLGGGERYKLELADRLEPLHQALGSAGGLRGDALLAARLAALRARTRLRRSERAQRLYVRGLAPARRALRRRSR